MHKLAPWVMVMIGSMWTANFARAADYITNQNALPLTKLPKSAPVEAPIAPPTTIVVERQPERVIIEIPASLTGSASATAESQKERTLGKSEPVQKPALPTPEPQLLKPPLVASPTVLVETPPQSESPMPASVLENPSVNPNSTLTAAPKPSSAPTSETLTALKNSPPTETAADNTVLKDSPSVEVVNAAREKPDTEGLQVSVPNMSSAEVSMVGAADQEKEPATASQTNQDTSVPRSVKQAAELPSHEGRAAVANSSMAAESQATVQSESVNLAPVDPLALTDAERTATQALPPSPVIALVLPTVASGGLGDAARMIQAGVKEAARAGGGILKFYPGDTTNAVTRYRRALKEGAQVIIGPLSRPQIAQIAPYATIPTLALNTLDTHVVTPDMLYTLNLSGEDEARQIVRHLRQKGYQRPLVLRDNANLSMRMVRAFEEAWQSVHQTKPVVETRVPEQLDEFDVVFLASPHVSTAKKMLTKLSNLPVFSSSHIYDSAQAEQALFGVQIVDMPWLHAKNREPVKRYQRPKGKSWLDERLYALGIDAWRVAVQMNNKGLPADFHLEGVTGALSLTPNGRHMQRQLPVVLVGAE